MDSVVKSVSVWKVAPVFSRADKDCSTQMGKHLIKRSARCHSWGNIGGSALGWTITSYICVDQSSVYCVIKDAVYLIQAFILALPLLEWYLITLVLFKPWLDYVKTHPNTFKKKKTKQKCHTLLQRSPIISENQCHDLKLIMTKSLGGKLAPSPHQLYLWRTAYKVPDLSVLIVNK